MAGRLLARVNPTKRIELVTGVAVTRLTIIPRAVKGRIVLEFLDAPPGSVITKHAMLETDAVTPEEAKAFSEMSGDC